MKISTYRKKKLAEYSVLLHYMECTVEEWKADNPDEWKKMILNFKDLHHRLFGEAPIGGKPDGTQTIH